MELIHRCGDDGTKSRALARLAPGSLASGQRPWSTIVAITPDQATAHEAAVAKGEAGYLDPVTGLFVLTATYLTERGYCCGNGCRHCPYPADADGDDTRR